MGFWRDCRTFFGEYRRRTRDTGSVLPSSRFLSRALASELSKPRGPARILEVGPGTGPVTREIVRHLRPDDRFDIVELNPIFVAHLRKRFTEEEAFRQHQHQTQIIEGPIESVPGQDQYDFIVSGLPLNGFTPELVRSILPRLRKLAGPGCILSYFEYIGIRHLQMPLAGKKGRRKLAKITRIVGSYIKKYQVRRQHIWMNVPPAYVRHLRLKETAPKPT